MANTTISISRKFQSWLKFKGKKGEKYEDTIKGLLKPETLKDLDTYTEPHEETSKAEPKKQTKEAQPDVVDTMFGGNLSDNN